MCLHTVVSQIVCVCAYCRLACTMVDRQDVLRDAWLGGSIGHFSALTEARIWALREAWREFKDIDYGMTKFIAERVTVVGGSDPWSSAITEFFKKIAD